MIKIGYKNYEVDLPPNSLVVDIGSGNNPNGRANILVDKTIEESIDRSGAKAVVFDDRDFILADILRGLPFKLKSIDYAISCHVAEHVDDPKFFCQEINRVAKAGYIETPGPMSDLFLNEPFHKWKIFKKGDVLYFVKKRKYRPISNTFYSLYYYGDHRSGHQMLNFNNKYINIFIISILKRILNTSWKYLPYTYTCYEWKDEIRWKIIE
ncbi:MAG: methyltransferase domain-containing protein [Methanomicrobiales archaeon]|nr:methyltransferase domain-containing protein [Methanomicrobiales archaeon]